LGEPTGNKKNGKLLKLFYNPAVCLGRKFDVALRQQSYFTLLL
jgi:hypothetical protein